MVHTSFERPALAAGYAYAALQAAAVVFAAMFILAAKPPIGAPVADHAAYYAANATTLRLGNLLIALPAALLLFFAGGLYPSLRRLVDDSSMAMTAVAAAAAMALVWPLGAIMTEIGIAVATHGGDSSVVWGADGMAPMTLALSALPRAVLAGAVSAVLLAAGVARWVGWLGVAVAILSLIGSATMVTPALFPVLGLGLALFLVWIVAATGALLRQTRTPAAEKAIIVA